MKEGRGRMTHSGGKTDPAPRAINPAGAANIGIAKGNHGDGRDLPTIITPMDAGRGYSAPGIASTTHSRGSQGKH
jgi:hypothetical protein